MTKMNAITYPMKNKAKPETEEIDIDFLIFDVMIIKAESLKNRKLYDYADYLEKQLLKLKNREAKLDLGAPLK